MLDPFQLFFLGLRDSYSEPSGLVGTSLLLLLGIKEVRCSESLDSKLKGLFERRILSQDFTVLVEEFLST